MDPEFRKVIGAVLLLAATAVGCGRSDLAPGELALAEALEDAASVDEPQVVLPDVVRVPEEPSPSVCEPSEEACNAEDDDCNGLVDDLPPVACPGGGFSYCVAGGMSACPVRCEVCLPGSERVCTISYCTFWGTQTCTADGRSFGRCREHEPPAVCRDIARTHQDSPELEQCCLDNGFCCLDRHDLDGDGDRSEMLGSCDEVLCKL